MSASAFLHKKQRAVTQYSTLILLRHRLSLGGSEKLQLTGLLGSFKIATEIHASNMVKASS